MESKGFPRRFPPDIPQTVKLISFVGSGDQDVANVIVRQGVFYSLSSLFSFLCQCLGRNVFLFKSKRVLSCSDLSILCESLRFSVPFFDAIGGEHHFKFCVLWIGSSIYLLFQKFILIFKFFAYLSHAHFSLDWHEFWDIAEVWGLYFFLNRVIFKIMTDGHNNVLNLLFTSV